MNRHNNTNSESVARESTFIDMDFGLRSNPVTGDIAKKRDVEAIRQSCLNILLTNRGEKPFHPTFGSNIRSQLFELFDPAVRIFLEEDIRLSLQLHEPRVKVLSIDIQDRSDRNALEFRVVVEIQSPEPLIEEVGFLVERQR